MPNVPKPKPYSKEDFKQDADKYIKGYLGGFDKGEMNEFLKRSVSKIEDAGVMSSDEAKDFIKERAYYLKEFAKENKGETLPQMKASGGRVNYNQGSMEPDTMALKEKIEEIMDIEGVGFGEAFKQAMRELASQSKEND
jgi:hypothetical protein